jgi:thioredoxin 1
MTISPLRRLLCAASLLVLAATVRAEPGPYDESADAQQQVKAAQADAARARLPLLVVFGANWCGDCKVLDQSFKQGRVAALVSQRFKVVKVNVGRFDRNTDIAAAYGVPLKKGIPAVALLAPDGKLVHATQAGELADARSMGEQALLDYFTQLAAR